jgi:hypothetical protein
VSEAYQTSIQLDFTAVSSHRISTQAAAGLLRASCKAKRSALGVIVTKTVAARLWSVEFTSRIHFKTLKLKRALGGF